MPSQLSRSLSPLPPQQDGLATQDHSTAGQACQAKSSGLHPFGFPLRIIPHGFEKHQGPRPPLEAYQETQRWIEWDRDPDDPDDAGLWTYDWLKKPTPDDVSLLVEEMVLQRILPGCFSGDGGDQEAATARTDPFNSGDHKELYTLRCRCCPTSQEKQAAFAGLSPRDLSQPSSGIESQRPLNSSSPLAPSGCCSTLLHHDGGGDGKDSCNGSHIPGEVLLRPSLPLDPYSHMESDVAIAHATEVRGVPVPRIYAYDSSAINFLGIEWQIVENISEPVADLLDQIISEEHKVLWAYGRPPAGIGTGRSAAWTRLGRQLEETLALLRSEENRSYRGQSSGACFDKMGSLYWDFEKHDFFLGPVTERYFTSGRRILATSEIPTEKVPEGLVPWRSDDGPGGGSAPVESAGSGGSGCSNVHVVRGTDSDIQQREVTTRQLTNAEVLFHIVFDDLYVSVGKWSKDLVDPLVEMIQAHIANEGEK